MSQQASLARDLPWSAKGSHQVLGSCRAHSPGMGQLEHIGQRPCIGLLPGLLRPSTAVLLHHILQHSTRVWGLESLENGPSLVYFCLVDSKVHATLDSCGEAHSVVFYRCLHFDTPDISLTWIGLAAPDVSAAPGPRAMARQEGDADSMPHAVAAALAGEGHTAWSRREVPFCDPRVPMGQAWHCALTSRAAPDVSATLGRGSCRATRANADSRVPHAVAAALRCAMSPFPSGVGLCGGCPEGRLSSSCSTEQDLWGLSTASA